MKKYIFIALAAIAALSSCAKESLVSNDENGKEAQVFTATMEDGITTKVTFDATNKCALWEVGDAISIDGHTYSAEQAGASSTFTGSGATESTHHAYFPASIYNGGTPALPAELTYAEGKFNMPMYAESSSLDLSFKNLCAVLAITVNKSNLVSTTTTSLKSIKVSSDKRMNGAFSATSAGVLSFTSQAALIDTDKSVTLTMTDAVDISTDKTFYIAIPAQEYSYLKIYLSADGTTYKEAMITQKAAGLGTIARSTMFNITYKTNAVKLYAESPYWATMNIGATSETGFGLYFRWGEKTGHALTATAAAGPFTGASISDAFEGTYNFSTNPTIDGSTQDPATLPASNDAATVYWGAAWKMPIGGYYSEQFYKLYNNTTSAWTDDHNSTGVKGRTFTGKTGTPDYSDITLFFPAAGYGVDTSLEDAGSNGFYWSNSLRTDNHSRAYSLCCGSGGVDPQYLYGERYHGFSVRPVSD